MRRLPPRVPLALAFASAFVLAFVFVGAPPAGAAQPASAEQLVQQLAEAQKGVASLSGEFTQRTKVKLFKQQLTSKGRLYFRAPRQVRWEYLDPDPSVLVLDGQKATLSAPGSEARVFDLEHDATMRAIFDQLLLWLGPGGLDRARADYELAAAGSAAQPVLVLTPRATSPVAKAFSRIELRIQPKTGLIASILLVEKNGDEKEITFTRLEKNAKLPPDAFQPR